MRKDYLANSFGIYVHIPFCQRKCPYCDFNSYATTSSEVTDKESLYVDSLIREFEVRAETFKVAGRKCSSVFFGGGTPSLFSGKSFKRLLDAFKKVVEFQPETEVTMEVNPKSIAEDISQDKFKQFFDSGINRVSIGAQSFNAEKLKFLGRWHGVEDTVKTFELARKAGFRNINLDLMYGLEIETLDILKNDLNSIVSLGPEHISAYMLTIEPGTVFGKMSKKGGCFTVTDDEFAEYYGVKQAFLTDNDYQQYEVSNFSKAGLQCNHNLLYWKGGEYLALGAGAHGFIKHDNHSGLRWANTPSPDVYANRIKKSGEAVQHSDPVSEKEFLTEYVSFGLRLKEGIDCSDLTNYRSKYLVDLINSGKLTSLFERGFLNFESKVLSVPLDQFHLVDGVVSEILVA